MQLCDGMLRLGGSVEHTVPMVGITPAEIVVLMQIHGSDALADLRPTKMDARTHAAEYDRLASKYDTAGATLAGDGPKSIMSAMFPGAVKKLPVTLDDIGMGWVMTGIKPVADDADEVRAEAAVADLVDGNVEALSQFGAPLAEDDDDDDGVPQLGDGGDGMGEDD